MKAETTTGFVNSHRLFKGISGVLFTVVLLHIWGGTASATGESDDGELTVAISHQGQTIAEYRITQVPLERTGDEYDAQLPESDNWLICGEEYIVFYFEMTELKEGYLPPISTNGLQLLYEDGETISAIPNEDLSYHLNEELAENEGLIFLPIPQTVAPPETARFSYSIREEVPELYGGAKSVRILKIGELIKEINEEDWKW
ncbi:MAG: hypothetical protein GY771_03950 [bacterium]|nr:hypothetical protein [bacterium]